MSHSSRSDTFESLQKFLLERGIQNLLLVTGGSSFKGCGAKTQFEGLSKGCFKNLMILKHEGSNPHLENIEKHFTAVKEFAPDLVLAIGGGGPLDTAKVLSANFDNGMQCRRVLAKESTYHWNSIPMVAVPTTVGTGAEETAFAVLYDGGIKFSLADPSLRPVKAFLIPSLLNTLDSYQTASTACDALCQAIESFWSAASTSESEQCSEAAVRLILEHIVLAVSENNLDSKACLLTAANYAGKAINVTKTTAPHAMSYEISAISKISHGHSVAMTFANTARYTVRNMESCKRSQKEFEKLNNKISRLFSWFDVAEIDEFCLKFDELLKSCGLPPSLKAVGISTPKQLEQISDSVNEERLKNHPIKITKAGIMEILNSSL